MELLCDYITSIKFAPFNILWFLRLDWNSLLDDHLKLLALFVDD